MHGTTPGLRDDTRVGGSELARFERERPELAPWLRPLDAALAALGIEPWRSLAPRVDAARGSGAPLLEGATVPVPPQPARALVGAVLGEALGARGRAAAACLDAVDLLVAAVACERARIERLAAEVELDPAALAIAAQLAAIPLLQGARRALAPEVVVAWSEPGCPVCGALPALVEVRGLERTRTLRCGRCGVAWTTEVLLCAFCGERDHERLADLVPEGTEGQLRWVETCASCGGYLKAFTTLRGAAPEAVVLTDAASIELDLAALERGFRRPQEGGRPAHIRLAPAEGVAG